jgi:hypothetical protein
MLHLYEMDFWGGSTWRRGRRPLRAELWARRFNREAVRLTLIADVAKVLHSRIRRSGRAGCDYGGRYGFRLGQASSALAAHALSKPAVALRIRFA